MKINWRQVLLRGVQVSGFSVVMATFDTLIWPVAYRYPVVYSVCIGMLCWLVIEFGRLLVPSEHCRHNIKGGDHGWPKGWRGWVLTAAGIAAGFFGGMPLAGWLLNTTDSLSLQDHMLALLLTVLASAALVFFFYGRTAQQAQTLAAERDAAQARLMLLQSQLEPHMLFNTLANLDALIGTDPATARFMLNRLNGFLRTSLSASRATSHPLAAEFDRLRDYLALMSIRMGPRLACSLHLPDELRAQSVPPLLLQPLVENAIKHGLAPCEEGGCIEVSAAREGQQLALTVRDTGIGFDTALPITGEHFGLTQVIERIASVYRGEGQVQVQSQPGHGTTVRITVPLQQDTALIADSELLLASQR
jgi:signal transduction histidine kinase